MKYYSSFTTEYVQDICNTLNGAGIRMADNVIFASKNFDTLTEFLQSHIIHSPYIFGFLDGKGLINRGRCPYTGQQISKSSPNWSYFNRTVYVSPRGYKIMQREDDESFEELFGQPAPKRNELSGNKGCSVLLAGIATLIGIGIGIVLLA